MNHNEPLYKHQHILLKPLAESNKLKLKNFINACTYTHTNIISSQSMMSDGNFSFSILEQIKLSGEIWDLPDVNWITWFNYIFAVIKWTYSEKLLSEDWIICNLISPAVWMTKQNLFPRWSQPSSHRKNSRRKKKIIIYWHSFDPNWRKKKKLSSAKDNKSIISFHWETVINFISYFFAQSINRAYILSSLSIYASCLSQTNQSRKIIIVRKENTARECGDVCVCVYEILRD